MTGAFPASPIYFIIALFVVVFVCAFGACEWFVKRGRGSRGDDRSSGG